MTTNERFHVEEHAEFFAVYDDENPGIIPPSRRFYKDPEARANTVAKAFNKMIEDDDAERLAELLSDQ